MRAGKLRAGRDLKYRVMRAARQLFSEQGFHDTNTRMIAKKAGTSETGIYRLYSGGNGKYELLVAVYDECWREIREVIEMSGAIDRPDPRAAIRAIVRIFWEACENDPQIGRLLVEAWAADRRLSRTSDESHKFVASIRELCHKVCEGKLIDDRLTDWTLTEAILVISEGIPRSWYFPRAPRVSRKKVTLDEGMAIIDLILGYREK